MTIRALPCGHCALRLQEISRTLYGVEKETETTMSQYYKQMQHRRSEAKRLLAERLARKEIGDATYDETASYTDDRAFKAFGVVFIAVFALAVLGVMWLGY